MIQTGSSIGEASQQGARALQEAGIEETAGLEAALLLGRAAGLDRVGLVREAQRPLSAEQHQAYEELLGRRRKREPLQYILGEAHFYGLALEVNPDVLIPRPDTETLVEVVLDLERERGEATKAKVADLGTGSGAIAIALAHKAPHFQITATDLSAAALAVAKRNAERHRVHEQINFREGDGLAALPGPMSYLVSNPPYIAEEERAELMPEVRDHEPSLALFPGPDPLRFYRMLATQGAHYVLPGGYLVVEVGADQAYPVAELIAEAEWWEEPQCRQDLAGIGRVVYARRLPG